MGHNSVVEYFIQRKLDSVNNNNILNLIDHNKISVDRLAGLEIARFQEQLMKKLTEEMQAQLENNGGGSGTTPLTGAVSQATVNQQEHDWNFARAFLYSLTVLTTIGKWGILLLDNDYEKIYLI